MTPKPRIFPAVILAGLLLTASAWANDSAASVAMGGIKLTREPRVSMEKEKLTISADKVTVEYEFYNDTDKDIRTYVAFPIPPYKAIPDDAGKPASFDDFRVWVDGKPINYETRSSAELGKFDVTNKLTRAGVDPDSFGHFDEVKQKVTDIAKLPAAGKAALVDAGLVDADLTSPKWTVKKTYFWLQDFPAHARVKIRHEYTPAVGFANVKLSALDKSARHQALADPKTEKWESDQLRQIEGSCVSPEQEASLIKAVAARNKANKNNDGDYLHMLWADYILTTANSWKMPIKDFQLAIDGTVHDKSLGAGDHDVAFCWDGTVQRLGQKYLIQLQNFEPRRQLHVTFLRP